jgi:hypothetical protein
MLDLAGIHSVPRLSHERVFRAVFGGADASRRHAHLHTMSRGGDQRRKGARVVAAVTSSARR